MTTLKLKYMRHAVTIFIGGEGGSKFWPTGIWGFPYIRCLRCRAQSGYFLPFEVRGTLWAS